MSRSGNGLHCKTWVDWVTAHGTIICTEGFLDSDSLWITGRSDRHGDAPAEAAGHSIGVKSSQVYSMAEPAPSLIPLKSKWNSIPLCVVANLVTVAGRTEMPPINMMLTGKTWVIYRETPQTYEKQKVEPGALVSPQNELYSGPKRERILESWVL